MDEMDKKIIIEFLNENWEDFSSFCEDREVDAEEIFDQLESETI